MLFVLTIMFLNITSKIDRVSLSLGNAMVLKINPAISSQIFSNENMTGIRRKLKPFEIKQVQL